LLGFGCNWGNWGNWGNVVFRLRQLAESGGWPVFIKAITTSYRGYRYRSRLEARYAVFFDQLAVAYSYEPEGFDLPSGRYLPDFWLPSLACWLEVKPEAPSTEERTLCEELSRGLGQPVVIASGTPGEERLRVYCADVTGSSAGCMWWDGLEYPRWAFTKDGRVCINSGDDFPSREFFAPDYSTLWSTMQLASACRREQFAIDRAYRLARSARFEFGETPK
jgi:hypothetical protein